MNVDFQLEEHGGVNIQAEDNTPMEEDDNVPEDMIEEDGIGAGDEEDFQIHFIEFSNPMVLANLIMMMKMVLIYLYLRRHMSPYMKAPKQLYSRL